MRVLGLGAGVGRVRGEGEKRARGWEDWASADWAIRPRAGVSLPFFSLFFFFFLLLQNFSKENFKHKQSDKNRNNNTKINDIPSMNAKACCYPFDEF
jgi:hypothetical protein